MSGDKKPETVFVGCHVTPEMRDQIRDLAKKEERSISAIFRRAVRNELERTKDEA